MSVFILITFSMVYMGFPGQTSVSCGFVAFIAGFVECGLIVYRYEIVLATA